MNGLHIAQDCIDIALKEARIGLVSPASQREFILSIAFLTMLEFSETQANGVSSEHEKKLKEMFDFWAEFNRSDKYEKSLAYLKAKQP